MKSLNKAAAVMGKIGGKTTKRKHGTDHYRNMAKKSAEVRQKKAVDKSRNTNESAIDEQAIVN